MIEDGRIFNDSELADNAKKREALFDLVRSGESILMAGAGCSAGIYANWRCLIEILTTESQEKDPAFLPLGATEDELSFADRVKVCIGKDRYYSTINKLYKPKQPTHLNFHEALCSMPFRGITTTNYDLILEYAWSKVKKEHRPDMSLCIYDGIEEAQIFEFLLSLNDKRIPKKIFHIHGIYSEKNSIVLCGEEYKEKYGFSHQPPEVTLYQNIKDGISESEFEKLLLDHGLKWTPHRKILWSLFATRRMVFLGFSMDDPYFQKMLDFVSFDLHTYDFDTHYLVLRITKDKKDRAVNLAKRLKKEYGVETVFFEDDSSYKGLERFVLEMNEAITQQPDITPIKKETDVSQIEEEDLTEYLFTKSKTKNVHED